METDASCTSFFSRQSATKPVNAHLMSCGLERGDEMMLHRCCETGFRWGGRNKCVYICHTNASQQRVLVCEQRGEAGGGVLCSDRFNRRPRQAHGSDCQLHFPLSHLPQPRSYFKKTVSWWDAQHVLPHAAVNTGIRSERIDICRARNARSLTVTWAIKSHLIIPAFAH